MAEITPTPAPQDAAAAVPNATASVPQTETEQTPMGQLQPPTTTAPSATAPASPAAATPPAASTGAQAPASVTPRRGFFEHVLTGALKGAEISMKAAGKAAIAVGKNSGIGQNIQNQKLARAAEQQRMQQSKQQAEDTHQISMDTHAENLLRYNSMSMDNMHKAAENAQIESLYPLQTAEVKNALLGQVREQNDADIKFLTSLEDAGVHVDTSHYTQGGPFDQLTTDHAKAIATGKQVSLNNGKTGPDADLAFVSVPELANTPLKSDMTVVTDWNLDPKSGEIKPIYSTLKAGENTALDALIAHNSGMDRFNQKQDMYTKQITAKSEAAKSAQAEADAAEKRSAAALNDAYVEQLGGGPGGNNPPPQALQQAISNLDPQIQKALQQYSPQIQGLLIRGAYGWIDPATFPQRLTKGGIGITRSQATSAMLEINPQYSDNLYNNIKKTQADFLTGKEGQSIRSFNQFLVHAAELKSVSDGLQRTSSPLLNVPINELKTKYSGQAGVPELMTAIEAARQEWQTFIDSGYAPNEEQNKRANVLMSDTSSPSMINGVLGVMGTQSIGRLDQLNETYKTATGQEYPNLVTPSGVTAAQQLGLNVSKYQSGGNLSGNKPQVPAGKVPIYSKKTGQVAGYADDANLTNFHPF